MMLKKLKKFLRATLIGGIVAILPLALILFIANWIVELIEKYLGPLVQIVLVKFTQIDTKIKIFGVYVVAVIAIMLLFFLIGLVIQTRVGQFFNNVLEDKYLSKIPGYKLAKETVKQFFGKNKSFFSEVVLVDVFNCGTLMTGFITDDHGDFVTLFIPTGPNPTSGNIYHVKKDKIIHTNATVDSGMKSIISCGAGSSEIFKTGIEKAKEKDLGQPNQTD